MVKLNHSKILIAIIPCLAISFIVSIELRPFLFVTVILFLIALVSLIFTIIESFKK